MRLPVAILLLCALVTPVRAQYLNPAAQIGVYNVDGATILQGTAVVLAGGTTHGFLNVSHPGAADIRPAGVADTAIPAASDGVIYQTGQSPIRLRMASGATAGANVRIANTSGEFETAPIGSYYAIFQLVTTAMAGSSGSWALPISSRPVMIAAPAGGSATGSTSAPTTTSATPAVIPEMTLTFTTSGGPVLCVFSASIRLQPSDAGVFALYLDGVEVPGTRRTVSNSAAAGNVDGSQHTSGIRSVAAGSHTIAAYWAATGGTLRALSTQRSLDCRELN